MDETAELGEESHPIFTMMASLRNDDASSLVIVILKISFAFKLQTKKTVPFKGTTETKERKGPITLTRSF